MRFWKFLLPLLATSLCFAAQPNRISGPIDSSQMVALSGSVHGLAQPQFDQGAVEDSLQFGYVTLLMAPSASQQAALEQLLAQQQDRSSPNFHKWLTPEQYSAQFGLSQADVNKITGWLEAQGLAVVSVARGRDSIVFSGTAQQIRSVFKTEINHYSVNGEKHIANATPVSIPAALRGVVTGVRGLNDFRLKPMYVRPAFDGKNGPHPHYTTTVGSNTDYFLAPGDIATIYNINPLYNASTPINGTGEKLAIMGQTDIYLADLVDFRAGFSLPSFTCTTGTTGLITACSATNFSYVLLGTDPGSPSLGDLFEADLDVEWSGAIAQNAQIIFVNAETTNGVNDALTYAIDNTIAPVISMSYGECEFYAGTMEPALAKGVSEGITILNSAGDVGSAACDYTPPGTNPTAPYTLAQGGLAVSYPASSTYVTGVGGTSIPSPDYTSTFWGPTNGTQGGSALASLIGQEVAWNDDEAFATYCLANPGTSGGFCDPSPGYKVTSAETYQEDYWISAGGGGVSNCYTPGTASACVSGFPKPSWQSTITIPGLTSPQNTYRFVPDVSLLASPNYPGYILCTPVEEVSNSSQYNTDTASTCANGIAGAADGTVSGGNFVINPSIVGGTSASAPVFAGIITLMNQALGSSGLSNINPKLYEIAGNSFYSAFHHVTTGDSNVYCDVGFPVGNPADVVCPAAAVFGFSASSADTATGYNLVTGLGSVDANALATDWAESLVDTTTSLVSSTNQTAGGLGVTLTAAISPSTTSGAVSFYVQGTSAPLGTTNLSGGTAALTTTALPTGTDSIIATYNGINASSTSSAVSVMVTQADFSMSVTSPLNPSSLPAGQSASAVLSLSPVNGAGIVNFAPSSCAGLPTGATCVFSPPAVTFGGVGVGTTTLTIATAANMSVPTGPQTITVTGTLSTGGATHTASVTLSIAATNQSFTIAPTTGAATYSIAAGATESIGITVTGAGSPTIFSPATLPLTYTCTQSSLPTQAQCGFSPTTGQAVSQSTLTLTITTTPPTSQLRPPLGHGSGMFYALLLPGLFGIVIAAGSRGRGAKLLGLIVVLGISTMWLGACGGGGSGSQKNPGTPAGTYAIVVNATTGGATPLTATFTVNLTVTN
jgi:subtilase family serine protease